MADFLLNSLQRLFRTDVRYVVKNGFWLTAKEVVATITGFILSLFFANLINPETYGRYSYILSVLNILLIPTLSGMGGALTQAVARGYDKTTLSALYTRIRWGVIGSCASLLLSGWYFLQHDTQMSTAFLISALFIPILDTFKLYEAFLVGKKAFRRLAISIIVSKLTFACVMTIVILLKGSLLALTTAYLVMTTLLAFTLFLYTKKTHTFGKDVDGSAIGYGKHLSLMNVLFIIASHIDQVIIFNVLGPIKLAVYTFATKPPKLIKSFLQNIQTLALPKIAASDMMAVRKTLPKKILIFNLCLVPVVIGYIALSGPFYAFFFPQYLESVRFSQLFALMLLFFPRGILSTALVALKQKRFLYFAKISNALIKICLLVLLAPLYGIYGAVSAIVISDAIHYAIVSVLFLRLPAK